MPLDALCLSGVIHELSGALAGGRIDKIYQPGRDEVVLGLRSPQTGNVKLLLSASQSHPRAQLTALNRKNPDAPPMFCMLLRKHLTGGRLLAISQPPMERIVDLRFEATNELGDRVERRLVLEAISRRANLLLLDGEGRILDCIRRVDSGLGSAGVQGRILQPGMFYRLPPAVEKADPAALSHEELEGLFSAAPEGSRGSSWLLDTFGGLSPLICRELCFRAWGDDGLTFGEVGESSRSALLDRLEQLLTTVKQNAFIPTMLTREERPFDFSFIPIGQYHDSVKSIPFSAFSPLLDQFYEQKEQQERVKQRGQDLIRAVTNARDRTARKIAHQEQELAATQNREQLRQFGDILTSNLHCMERGMNCLHTVDFYDPEQREVDIRLDPLLTPQQNAAKYYKEYNKAKTAEKMLTIQLAKGRTELEYLNSVLENISLSEGERDLREIRQELAGCGYLRGAKAKGQEKRANSKPMEFRSSAGLRISVGKNNTQNDLLTCKQAFKSDIWFHTQKIHGSHVILWTEGKSPDAQSLNEAACLAAWFSQGRDGGKVPVDYTPVKFVKKPAGARPGMVVYTTYETAWVAPDGELAKRLRVK